MLKSTDAATETEGSVGWNLILWSDLGLVPESTSAHSCLHSPTAEHDAFQMQ